MSRTSKSVPAALTIPRSMALSAVAASRSRPTMVCPGRAFLTASANEAPIRPRPTTPIVGISDAAGGPAERFGAQVAQMLGAAEHRSERIRQCVSEERRLQQRRWAAWAPKIPQASLAASLLSELLGQRAQQPAEILHEAVEAREVPRLRPVRHALRRR